MVSLSATPDVRAQWRETGRHLATGIAWLFYALGWLASNTLKAIGVAVGAVFYTLGFVASKVVWPALRFCGQACRAGWDAGRKGGAA